ncbi:MAG TPA: FHA domain-containing protein [Candidatus Baltobacteraceae bacterium]|nr:FHA domain-containing protein [Candidatus Baltobacteraceae bacterium]
MNFPAVMRLGSLEILGALAAFGLVAARLRPGALASRARALTVSLAVQEPAAPGRASRAVAVTIAAGTPCALGRTSQADVELDDPEVSRRHARLDLVRGVLYVSDAGSSNGTFLNGKPLGGESIELRPGDDIDVGNTRITVNGMEAVQ